MKVINLIKASEEWKVREKREVKVPQLLPTQKAVLTKREIEIIQLMFDDYNSLQIAKKLSISSKTVDTHRKNMLKKTGIHSPVGLIKFGLAHGLIRIE